MTVSAHPADHARPGGDGFEVRVRPAREVVWVKPVGELDLATGPELREPIEELLAVGFDQVIVDLRGLSFIAAAGVRLLLSLAGEAESEGWRLWLIQGGPTIQRMFALTGTLQQLPFTASVWGSHTRSPA